MTDDSPTSTMPAFVTGMLDPSLKWIQNCLNAVSCNRWLISTAVIYRIILSPTGHGRELTPLQPQHIRHAVPPRALGCQPLGGFEGAVGEGVAVGGDVGQLQPLAERGETGGVATDLVADAQGVHADLAALASGVVAVAVEDQRVPRLVRGLEDRVGQAERRAGGGIFLETMMGLDDLDVIVVAQSSSHLGGDLEQQVHAQAHVGGLEDRDLLGGDIDGGVVGVLEARGADHHRDAAVAAGLEPVSGGWRRGEVDQHLRRGPQVERDGQSDRADPRDFTRVARLRGMLRALDRADELEGTVLFGQRDQSGTHATRGAGDRDRDHGTPWSFSNAALRARRGPSYRVFEMSPSIARRIESRSSSTGTGWFESFPCGAERGAVSCAAFMSIPV